MRKPRDGDRLEDLDNGRRPHLTCQRCRILLRWRVLHFSALTAFGNERSVDIITHYLCK